MTQTMFQRDQKVDNSSVSLLLAVSNSHRDDTNYVLERSEGRQSISIFVIGRFQFLQGLRTLCSREIRRSTIHQYLCYWQVPILTGITYAMFQRDQKVDNPSVSLLLAVSNSHRNDTNYVPERSEGRQSISFFVIGRFQFLQGLHTLCSREIRWSATHQYLCYWQFPILTGMTQTMFYQKVDNPSVSLLLAVSNSHRDDTNYVLSEGRQSVSIFVIGSYQFLQGLRTLCSREIRRSTIHQYLCYWQVPILTGMTQTMF